MRAIVLILCLASAVGIAGYTQYSRGDPREPVYTVPNRPSDSVPRPAEATEAKHIEPNDRAALARALQRELKRVGCYNGDITGVWTTSSRMAMRTFVERVNATLPIDNPDPVLLSLVQGHPERACRVACPAGQAEAASGACAPSAMPANAVQEQAPDAKPDADKAGLAAAAAAGTAAALALTPPAAASKQNANAETQDIARPAAAPQTGPQSGPTPPERTRERRPRRSAQGSPPPKVVRDIMKALGIK